MVEYVVRFGDIMVLELKKLNLVVVKIVRGKGFMNVIEIRLINGKICKY